MSGGRLFQESWLGFLVVVLSLLTWGCGEEDTGPDGELSIRALMIAPEGATVEVAEEVSFEVSELRLQLADGSRITLDLEEEGLDDALDSAKLEDAERDRLEEALRELEWASEEENIAELDGSGLNVKVTGGEPGTTTITATLKRGGAARELLSKDLVASAELTVLNGEESSATDAGTNSETEGLEGWEPPESYEISVGETRQLEVAALDEDGELVNRTADARNWRSSDEAIATVDAEGAVTGIAPGTTTIEAELDGRTLTFDVTVIRAGLAALPEEVSVSVGAELDLGDLVGTGSEQRPVWQSADETVVVIDEAGVATGIAPGETVITVTLGEDRANVTVVVFSERSLILVPDEVTFEVGQVEYFTAMLIVDGGDPEPVAMQAAWSVLDDDIAVVDGDGILHAEAAGETTLSATFDGLEATAAVTVTPAQIVGLELLSSGGALAPGEDVQLTAEVEYSHGGTRDVTTLAVWTSSDPSISVVDGLLSAAEPGVTATISVVFEGVEAVVSVTVQGESELVVTPASVSLAAGETVTLAVSVTLPDGSSEDVTAEASYLSDNEASVTANGGQLNAVAEGVATITVSHEELQTEVLVTVSAPVVTAISLLPPELALQPGQTQQLVATAVYSDGVQDNVTSEASITWASDDGSVATVDSAGQVNAVAPGQTRVRATYSDGVGDPVSSTVTLLVADGGPTALVLSESAVDLDTGSSLELQVTLEFSDGSAYDVTESSTWTVADTSVATVVVEDGSAILTGNALGETELSATWGGGITAVAAITVTD